MYIPSGITPMTFYEQNKNMFTHVKITFIDSNIVFEDEDIESSGIEIKQYMNSDTDLKFGTASCAEVTISFIRSSKMDELTWSDEFLLQFGYDDGEGGIDWFDIGYFTGSKPDRTRTDVISFIAYDRMTKFNVLADDFIDSLDFQAENLLGGMTVNDLKDRNNFGTWSGNVYTYSGMVFTPIVENGVVTGITVNGDSGSFIPTMIMDYVSVDHTKKYYLFGCPLDTGNESCFGSAVNALGDPIYGKRDKGYGTVVDGSQITTQNISYRIQAKGVVDNVVFRPHIQTSPLQGASLLGIYKTLCAYIGIEFETGDEIAANMANTYSEFPISKGCTCRDILAKIAEAAGCYAVITNAGKVKLVWYTDHTEDFILSRNDLFSVEISEVDWLHDDDLRKKWIDLENEKWKELEDLTWRELEGYYSPTKVNSVQFFYPESESGIIVPNALSAANVYTIVNNPFLIGATELITTGYITNIYNRLRDFGVYVPVITECVGNLFVEPGDIIKFEFSNNSYGNLPVFNRIIRYNGGLLCNYETTGSLQRKPISVADRIMMTTDGKLRRKYDKQSGIEITEQGIDITGQKHIILQAGDDEWKYTSKGLEYNDDNAPFPFQITNHGDKLDDATGIFSEYSSGHGKLILYAVCQPDAHTTSDAWRGALNFENFDNADVVDPINSGEKLDGNGIALYPNLNYACSFLGTKDRAWRRLFIRRIHGITYNVDQSNRIRGEIIVSPSGDVNDADIALLIDHVIRNDDNTPYLRINGFSGVTVYYYGVLVGSVQGYVQNKTTTETNLNNIKDKGDYWLSFANITNKPSALTSGRYLLQVQRYSSNHVLQTITTDFGIYTRMCYGGTWGSWYKHIGTT